MMKQVDLIHLKPLPPPPPPEKNVFMYCERITEVEEYYDEDDILHERPTEKEITTKIFYCEWAFFASNGICYGGCDTDATVAICMKKSMMSTYTTNTDSENKI